MIALIHKPMTIENEYVSSLHTKGDEYADLHTENTSLHTELDAAKNRINELNALLYQVLEQVDSDLFAEQVALVNRQNLIKAIKQRITLTTEILDIVNKSKQPQQESVNK